MPHAAAGLILIVPWNKKGNSKIITMGTQSGVLRLKGKVGELSFYRTKDGYGVRKSEGIDGKRIKNDPRYQRTRENAVEFGNACQSAKVLRHALRSYYSDSSDRYASRRLIRTMMEILHTDPSHGRGERVVMSGDLSKLKGFNFNEAAPLATTLKVKPTLAIDREAGTLTVSVPPINPLRDVRPVPGATYARLSAIAVEVDFEQKSAVVGSAESEPILLNGPNLPAISLTASLTPNSSLPVIALIALQFVQVVQDTEYSLNSGTFNSMAIIDVSNP